jgi:hypothetical protein
MSNPKLGVIFVDIEPCPRNSDQSGHMRSSGRYLEEVKRHQRDKYAGTTCRKRRNCWAHPIDARNSWSKQIALGRLAERQEVIEEENGYRWPDVHLDSVSAITAKTLPSVT